MNRKMVLHQGLENDNLSFTDVGKTIEIANW